jgi:hypothetical protein
VFGLDVLLEIIRALLQGLSIDTANEALILLVVLDFLSLVSQL